MPQAPLAPCGWPTIDLVDDPGSRAARSPNSALDARDFDRVVQLRRRAVIVDVADLFLRAARRGRARAASRGRSRCRRDPSARGDTRRRSSRSLRRRRRSCAPRARADSSRSSTTIHAPSPSTKPSRPRSNGRDAAAGVVVVARRHHPHAREAVHHAGRDARVDAARQQHVAFAGAQQRHAVADRIGRARAAGRQHVADAVQLQRDRDLARDHADDRHGDRVGRDLLQRVGEELAILPLADFDAAGAAADDDAGARLRRGAGRRRPRLRARRSRRRARRANSGADRRDRRRCPLPFTLVAGSDRRRLVDADRRQRRRDLTRRTTTRRTRRSTRVPLTPRDT